MNDIVALTCLVLSVAALTLLIAAGAVSLGVFLAERRWKDKK